MLSKHPARLPVAKLPAVAQVNELVAPIPAAPQAERNRNAMFPRPAEQKRQVETEDVESDHRIHPAHFAARQFPKLAQRPRLIIVADDGKLSALAERRRRFAVERQTSSRRWRPRAPSAGRAPRAR